MPCNGADLCKALSIDRKQLAAWIKAGLPCTGSSRRREFDEDAVAEWLIAQGYAEEQPPAADPTEGPIVHTIAEVARHFGKSLRTVHTWIAEGMPGRSGSPGRQDGHFPLLEIDRWLDGRKADTSNPEDSKHQAQGRLARARAAIAELDLAERRKQLLEVDEEVRRWQRHITAAKAQLKNIEPVVLRRLPADLPADIKKRIRRDLQRIVKRAYGELQQFLVDQATELESGSSNA